MNPPTAELEAVLAREIRELGALVRLMREEERALISADAEAVEALGQRKADLLLGLVALERRRESALGALSASLGAISRPLTLAELCRRLPQPAPALWAARDEMRRLLDVALALSERNGFLVERTLGWLRGILGQIAASLAPSPTYAGSGRPAPRGAALGLLDRRA